MDTIETLQKSGGLPRNTLCIPDGVTKGQLADAVKMYLGANPSRRHLDAGSLVPEALQRSFPCGR